MKFFKNNKFHNIQLKSIKLPKGQITILCNAFSLSYDRWRVHSQSVS